MPLYKLTFTYLLTYFTSNTSSTYISTAKHINKASKHLHQRILENNYYRQLNTGKSKNTQVHK